MPKLSDAQLVLLAAAAQHPDGLIIPPERLRGAAMHRTLLPLLRAGFVAATKAPERHPLALRIGDDTPGLVRVTREGLRAIGIDDAAGMADGLDEACRVDPAGGKAEGLALQSRPEGTASSRHQGSATRTLMAMISAEAGATLADLNTALGWQPHTTRAALSRLRMAGYAIATIKATGEATRYRLWPAAPDEDRSAAAPRSDRQDSDTDGGMPGGEGAHV